MIRQQVASDQGELSSCSSSGRMGKKVEMQHGEEKKEEGQQQTAATEAIKPLPVLRSNIALIEKAVAHKETRTLFGRLLRQTAAARKRLTSHELQAFLRQALPSPAQQQLLEAVKQVGCQFGGLQPSICVGAVFTQMCS